MNDLTPAETEAILTLCLMAAFADGEKHEREREQIRRIAESFRGSEVDLSALYQEVLLRKPEPATVGARLSTPGARQLAYELALAVCDAADARSATEQQFLTELHSALALSPAETDTAVEEVRALTAVPAATAAAAPPPIPSQPQPASIAQAEATDATILRYATIAGALELLPQTMATLAIVPLQTKLVYGIAKERGFEPDRKAIGEFMAAAGIGLASQMVEGFARRLIGGVTRKATGRFGGSIGATATGAAMSFASTYALGNLAQAYYDAGRTLDMPTLKAKFQPLLEQGKTLAEQYGPQIMQQSRQLQGAGSAG
jgi:uncharacterized protein (DUF697 family)/tellurite resistance protein